MTTERGKYVTRAVYQKLAEENKKLLADLKLICSPGLNPEAILCRVKWRNRFEKEESLHNSLKQHAQQYLKDHPEYDILKLKSNK